MLEPIQSTPLGFKMRYRHPDGMVVEYVEHQAEKLRKWQTLPSDEG